MYMYEINIFELQSKDLIEEKSLQLYTQLKSYVVVKI